MPNACHFGGTKGYAATLRAFDGCSLSLGCVPRTSDALSHGVFTVKRTSLSAGEARRLALAAQGFARPRPAAPPDWRVLRRTIKGLGLLQIDSVNVLVR